MKKSLITLGLLSAFALSVNAQDVAAPSGSEFKPAAGNVTFEVNALSPFADGGATPFELNNGLRFRYFLNESTAIRLNFSVSRFGFSRTYNNTNTATFTTPGTGTTLPVTETITTVDDKVVAKSSEFQFTIAPGIEKHINVSERLSVYYGAVVEFTMNSRKGSVEVTPGSVSTTSTAPGVLPNNAANFAGSYKETVKGGWYGSSAPAEISLTAPTTPGSAPTINLAPFPSGAFTRIGLLGVIGADYYITKGLYLGLEASWGVSHTSYKAVEITRSGSYGVGATTTAPLPDAPAEFSVKDDGKKGERRLEVVPAVNGAFRIGFWF